MVEMTLFSGMYLKWKRRVGAIAKKEDVEKETILKRSIDEETIANDLVMCSQIDSYLLVVIQCINNVKCSEIAVNQRVLVKEGLQRRTTCIHRLVNT